MNLTSSQCIFPGCMFCWPLNLPHSREIFTTNSPSLGSSNKTSLHAGSFRPQIPICKKPNHYCDLNWPSSPFDMGQKFQDLLKWKDRDTKNKSPKHRVNLVPWGVRLKMSSVTEHGRTTNFCCTQNKWGFTFLIRMSFFYILFFINFHSVIKEYERSIVFWWD